jgi:hypothetical protein
VDTSRRKVFRRRLIGDLDAVREQLEALVSLRLQGCWDDNDALLYAHLAGEEQRILARDRTRPEPVGGAAGMA